LNLKKSKSSIARFLLVQYTKMGKTISNNNKIHIPIDQKNIQIAVKWT
jgi:hypothetical protein